jgi:hypothetical protein
MSCNLIPYTVGALHNELEMIVAVVWDLHERDFTVDSPTRKQNPLVGPSVTKLSGAWV